MQLKYDKDIIVARYTTKLGIPIKEVLKVISDIGQDNCYVQADNWEEGLPNLKRNGHSIKFQTITA